MWRAGVPQDRLHRAVDLGVTVRAALVGQGPAIPDAGERQSVDDPVELLAVLMQPGERPDSSGSE